MIKISLTRLPVIWEVSQSQLRLVGQLCLTQPWLGWLLPLHICKGSGACPILCGLLWEPRLKEKAAVWASQRLERASGNLQYLSRPWWGTTIWSLLFTMTLIRTRPAVEPKVKGGGIHSRNCKITQQGYEYREGSQVLLEGWHLHLEKN